jgi:type II secretory pathway predicted ATPase ExeA
MENTLNEKQTDLLRYLSRQTGPVPADHLDGRVVRALKSRQLIDERNGWVSVSVQGRDEFETKIRRRRAFSPLSSESGTRNARAESIKRAIDALELALPRDAELMVGEMPAYADDVMEGLRRFARRLEGVSK